MEYADNGDDGTREQLVSAFDADRGHAHTHDGVCGVRPHSFGAYHSTNAAFLGKRFPELAATLSLTACISGE